MSDWDVAKREPDHCEDQHRRELHALGEGANDQRAGDASERGLEGHEDDFRDDNALAERSCHRERAGHVIEQPFAEQSTRTTKEGVALGEGEAVAVDEPEHHDQRERDHHLHQYGQHVLRAD